MIFPRHHEIPICNQPKKQLSSTLKKTRCRKVKLKKINQGMEKERKRLIILLLLEPSP